MSEDFYADKIKAYIKSKFGDDDFEVLALQYEVCVNGDVCAAVIINRGGKSQRITMTFNPIEPVPGHDEFMKRRV